MRYIISIILVGAALGAAVVGIAGFRGGLVLVLLACLTHRIARVLESGANDGRPGGFGKNHPRPHPRGDSIPPAAPAMWT